MGIRFLQATNENSTRGLLYKADKALEVKKVPQGLVRSGRGEL